MDKSIESEWVAFRGQLLNYIQSKVNDRYAADDILQEVFIKAYGNIDRLGNEASLKAWLYKITQNTIVDYYRGGNDTIVQLDNIEAVLIIDNESLNMNVEIAACLQTFLSGLPDKYREPLELYALHNSKHKEIAEKLGLTISGSKSRVQRARARLREMLISCCELEFDCCGNVVDYRKKTNCKCSGTC